MTTKDLENKLKINENTGIHCPTLELAKQVLCIFHQLGLKWSDKKPYTVLNHNWDSNKENTVYHPFGGEFSSLDFAPLVSYKIINAEEFIALHTEVKEFNLENYIPKGELEGFPKEIIARMLDCQEEQGNKRNVTVFERDRTLGKYAKGFTWDETQEDENFWHRVIRHKNFNLFFEKYPKQDNSQDFRVDDLENYIPKGQLEEFPKEIIARMLDCQEEQVNLRDVSVFEKHRAADEVDKGFNWFRTKEGSAFWEVIIRHKNFAPFFEKYPKKQEYQGLETAKYTQVDNNVILSDTTYAQSSVKIEINTTEESSQEFRVGDEVINIITGRRGKISQISTNVIYVNFNEKGYTLDGRCYIDDKYPRLLHYRDDYDYSVIDFNNLPKRQTPKRWRAEKGGTYYFVNFYTKGWFLTDESKDDYDYPIDNNNYNSGNYFRTEVEAEIIAQKLNKYFKQLVQEEHGQ